MSGEDVKVEMVFECSNCAAFRAHPDKVGFGECRRRAPSPLVLHWPDRPEVDEHGSLLGFRLVLWPATAATDACMEYMPGPEVAAQMEAQMEANEGAARH